MFVKGIRRQGEFKTSLRDSKDGKIFPRSCLTLEVGVGVSLDRECVEFTIAG